MVFSHLNFINLRVNTCFLGLLSHLSSNLKLAMMQKNTFMRKHRNSSCYHFRVRIPLDLQKHFKDKKDFTISLRTGVYEDASRTATRLYTLSQIISVCLSPEIKGAIWSLSTQMKCSPEETLEMSIREHFSLLRPQRWIRESWFQGGVVFDCGKD